ncbi:ABC transporter permease [Mycoplasmatota bacterium]|nr:ABC transporter permease [Mycoplasmatota bacterium]
MLNLIYCELLKLKRSKMLPLSMIGALATPIMMLLEALQTHFEYPERIFTLSDIYDSSLLYVMLLMNMMVYVAITAYLFSREYTEKTLKTILPAPVSRTKFIVGKFYTLFLWIIMLTVVTWTGILVLSALYHSIFGLEGFDITIALQWLLKLLLGGVLMFLTISPFAFLAERTKGLAAPMIIAAVMVMGSAALCNQKIGALYPWTATYFLIKGKMASTGYSIPLTISIIILVSAIGYFATFAYFKKEDLK